MKQISIYLMLAVFLGLINQEVMSQSPVDADMVVALDGTGDFSSIQDAIDATPSNSERRTVIYIKRGLYDGEKLIVTEDKINITIVGESREETVISYHIYDCSDGKCPPEDAALWTGDNIRTSATLTIQGDGFRAENLTIQNTAGPVGQAQAVTIRSDKCVFVNVNFYGYQDTMYFWSDGNRSYFENCLIVGRTDYIYGAGIAFFQGCEIRSWGGGWITAPSTAKEHDYGFVFYECDITYAENSPRGGDDGELVRLGRPWHEYPKVAWLYCNMTEMIHPQGWGDKWNMDYADTSADLHLYEYKNTGSGADMSGRADWVGIRELSDQEALDYTVQKVMAGNDNWDPTAEAPLLQNYTWTGNGVTNNWMDPDNWNPQEIPGQGASAVVDGEFTLLAEGNAFAADLILKNGAILKITESSTATYISVANATLVADTDVSLSGKVATKDSIFFTGSGELLLNSSLTGVHELIKSGSGTLVLTADNSGFSGKVLVKEGIINGLSANSYGKASVEVGKGASLEIGDDNAFYAKGVLNVLTGSQLILNADVTITEFYIDEVMQTVGEYSATTNPGLISGSGKVIVGRPDTFLFHRGSDGNWDNPNHYTPALLPQAGETVICEEEMETTSTVFEADIILRNSGKLRLRGDDSKNHTSTGDIYMKEGTSFRYNTSGTGMYLRAPIVVEGGVTFYMESSNGSGSNMTLTGPISGSSIITPLNNGKGNENTATLLLTGDNSGFSGIWDLTKNSEKYPSSSGYITQIEGAYENAFGKGSIHAGLNNRIIFSHSKAAGDSLEVTLDESAKIVLNTNVLLNKFKVNGTWMNEGTYSTSTNPEIFEGAGSLTVGTSVIEPPENELLAFPGAEGFGRNVTGGRGGQVIYVTNLEDNNNQGSLRYAINQSGPRIILFKVSGTIQLKSRLNISKGDVTIAGQTAPGDGITLRDYPVVVDANNVIIRFMRFRMGDAAKQEGDALGGRSQKNIIIDHCSMSWSTDECVSFYQNENFTLQWCIISESLRNSVHGKGSHGYGGIWGGMKATFHHNLLADHDSRNPRFCGSRYNNRADLELVDHRNNVIFNWGGNSAYGAEGGHYNIVNNYYKYGPATSSSKRNRIIQPYPDDGSNDQPKGIYGVFYVDGNDMTASSAVSNNNWLGVNMASSFATLAPGVTQDDIKSDTAFAYAPVTTHSAVDAYDKVLEYGGASLVRDAIDIRIINDVSTGTPTYTNGGNGSKNGIIDTQNAVGGWPELNSEEPPADTDEDGMPDDWENANGLNPDSGNDAQLTSVDGVYPNIEVYINSLVSDIVENQNMGGITGVDDNIPLMKNSISAYFNSGNELIIKHREQINEVAVYSVTGQLLFKQQTANSMVKVNASRLNKGIYIVRVRDCNSEVYSEKVIRF